jgi:hypothetical protein
VIKRSKTDQAGEGAAAYLAPETVRHLKRWLKASRIKDRGVLRRVFREHAVGERLSADIVADILKRVGERIGLPTDQIEGSAGTQFGSGRRRTCWR